ncbi:NADPH-dependent 7-cyano-7-deazaguanine reductase QueF [Candidatus Bathyarchaeota archaeon]|nr:NADPH-dependent 7-cyano-7-deazaguanine reductase QueF [Candidatus Bathyarchaeota archaeon]
MEKAILETIANDYAEKEYKVQIICPEFTCLCPGKRDQPDFAIITIIYIPDNFLLELKSLKYYLTGFRDEEIYHESATNKILQDLVDVLDPRYIRVIGDWNVRGGIKTIVEIDHSSKGWGGDPEKIDFIERKNTACQPNL